MKLIRIAIADDHSVVTEGLRIILKADPRFRVEYIFSNGQDLLAAIEKKPVDLVILDIDIPGNEDFAVLKKIKQMNPSSKVIIFSMLSGMQYFFDARKFGADSYVLKTESVTFIPSVIMFAMKGEFYFSEELKDYMSTGNKKSSLNPLELEVVNYISQGMQYKQIGMRLNRSEKTIEYYAGKIRKKLAVQNNSELLVKVSKKLI